MTEISTSTRQTLSSIFLLPSVEISMNTRVEFTEFGFVNCYAYCDLVDYPFKSIFALFEPEIFNKDFAAFIIDLESNPNHVETIDIPGAVIVCFRVPNKYIKDYNRFINGRYSRFSKEFKSLFPLKYYLMDGRGLPIKDPATDKPVTEYSMFYHIFNRTEQLRDKWYNKLGNDTDLPYELYEKFSEEKETLKYL